MARDTAPTAVLFIFATATSILLSVMPFSTKKSIVTRLGPVFFYPASRATEFLENLAGLTRENRALRARLAERLLDDARLYDAEQQNQRFRRMLDIRAALPFSLIPGQVIARPGHFHSEYLALDVGTEQGVSEGMGALSIRGLVGSVVEVRDNTCLVRSLFSPQSRVSIVVQPTGAGGILRFDGSTALIVPDIPLEEDVSPGDSVLTSGLGGIFPPGIGVGIVFDVSDDRRLLVHKARIQPFERFTRVREVFVARVDTTAVHGPDDGVFNEPQ
jgi:rod shape-determining protein MreC